jgi:hypothetical protein
MVDIIILNDCDQVCNYLLHYLQHFQEECMSVLPEITYGNIVLIHNYLLKFNIK